MAKRTGGNRKGKKSEDAAENVSNVVDFPESSAVESTETETETVNAEEGDTKMQTLTHNTNPRKGSSIVFFIAGTRLVAKFPRAAFGETIPDSIEVADGTFSVAGAPAPKAKMTPEEKTAARDAEKARVAGLSPDERASEARAKLEARAARLAKQADAVNAKLAAASAAPASE